MSCAWHGAFNGIPGYACALQIDAKHMNTSADVFPQPEVQKCCDIVNATVERVPGNTGCDIQWCRVPLVDYGIRTTTWLGAQEVNNVSGPDERVRDCLYNVRTLDLGLGDPSAFCVLRTTNYTFNASSSSSNIYASAGASWSSVVSQCYSDPSTWPVPVNPVPCNHSAAVTTTSAAAGAANTAPNLQATSAQRTSPPTQTGVASLVGVSSWIGLVSFVFFGALHV